MVMAILSFIPANDSAESGTCRTFRAKKHSKTKQNVPHTRLCPVQKIGMNSFALVLFL